MADTTICTSIAIATPDLEIIEGQITTTSNQVAEHFGKSHKVVLRAIRNLLSELTEDYRRNFAPIKIEFINGKGGTQQATAYRLTRDGFTLLAMGFTGKEAMQWKVAYLNAFNKMEQELLARTPYSVAPGQTLSAEQAQFLRTMLTDWVDSFPKDKQAAFMTQGWSKLKAHFKTDYRRIPAGEYHEAVNILARHIGGWMRDYNIVTTRPDPALPAPAIDPLNAQAMAAASKQANEYLDAARQGQFAQPTQSSAIPPEVLCGLLAQAMLNQRFMLSFDRHTGRMNLNPVPGDAFVLSWQQFAHAVVTNDIDPSNAELADLASACNRRLAQRLAA